VPICHYFPQRFCISFTKHFTMKTAFTNPYGFLDRGLRERAVTIRAARNHSPVNSV
jgi:hypothetical protein